MKLPCQSIVRLREKAGKAGIPVHAQIEVTHRCNLRCKHCYLTGHHESAEEELSFGEIIDLLDQLVSMQTMFLAFTGGEFFMREDAWEILQAATDRKFVITLLTNGTMLSRSDIERLKEFNLYQVHVSVLGDEKIHDEMSGMEGSFEKVITVLDTLRECGITAVAKLILTRYAATDYEKMLKIAEDHADDHVFAFDMISTISNTPLENGIQLCSQDLLCLPDDVAVKMDKNIRWDLDEYICNAGRGLMAVSPYGDIFPCISFRMPVGNIRESSVKEIWNSEEVKKLRNIKRSDLKDCVECDTQHLCTYCPGRSWSECGDYLAKSKELCTRAERMEGWIEAVKGKSGTTESN
ncbi:MAG: radical SAM protein [Planctomycetota bacterium]|jgi:radical SAM protein with 4Fe4S-binding SPASM domain